MNIIIFFIAVLFLWGFAKAAPLIAVLIAIGFGYIKAVLKKPSSETANKQHAYENERQHAYKEIAQLSLLVLELKQYQKSGKISKTEYDAWQKIITNRERDLYYILWKSQDLQIQQLDQAWQILQQHSHLNLAEPPWYEVPKPIKEEAIRIAEPIIAETIEIAASTIEPVKIEVEPIKAETIMQAEITAPAMSISTNEAETIPPVQVNEIPEPAPAIEPAPIPPPITETAPIKELKPAPELTPLWLKQIFGKVKEINVSYIVSKILLPFLWQNIGWFVAGFCIIFGSIYIVAYSSGFFKGLMILFSISLYCGLLLLCGYQIRARRPKLYTSSYVSIILSVLLIPLTFTVDANLLSSAESSVYFIIALITSIVLILSSLYVMQFATGLIERSLPKQYNYLFIALAAWQYISPLISQQHWILLVIAHFSLLAVLIYALQLCNHNWLQDIFLDKHKTSYYLVGTLFYAALVSFVYLTTSSKINLPNGYFGFFLIILCCLLFHVDRSIQTWLRKPAILNHLSFIIYGLSVVAILMAGGQSSWTDSIILSLTLIFSTALYAGMLWRYVSFPPLYLFLISSSWLYGSLILVHFSYDLYFLLSLPIFYGLNRLHKFALYRKSEKLAIICYRFLYSSVIALLALSLYFAQNSITAMLTPLMAVVVFYKIIPQQKLYENKVLAYFNIGLVTLSAYYTPLILHTNAALQFSTLLLAMAGFWLSIAIKNKSNLLVLTIFINSTLLSITLSCLLASQEYGNLFFPGILILSAVILIITSLNLYCREIFYSSLILVGTGFVLIKKLYFPITSGIGLPIIVFALYSILWFFKYHQMRYKKVNLQKDSLKILGLITQFYGNKVDTAQRPLELTMYLIWGLALWRVSYAFFTMQFSSLWGILAILTAISTFLITLYCRQIFLLTLTVTLLLGGVGYLLPSAELAECINLMTVFVLALWFVGLYLFNLKTNWMQVLTLEKKDDLIPFQKQLTVVLHHTIFILTSTSLLFIPSLLFNQVINQLFAYNAASLLMPLILIAIFFMTAGYYYKQRLHSYFVVSILIFTGLLSCGALFNISVSSLFSPQYFVIWQLITTAILTALFNVLFTYPKSAANQLYSAPLQHISVVSYILSVGVSLLLKMDNFSYAAPFLFLAILSFPLPSRLNNAAVLRGFSIPVLLSLFVLTSFNSYLFIGWSFILWASGYYVLPYINRTAKKDIISANSSAILGLYLIIINYFLNSNWLNLHDMSILMAFSSVYLCLMLKYPNWLWLRWITALAICMTGTAILLNLLSIQPNSTDVIVGFLMAFSALLFTLYSRQSFLLGLSILLLFGSISYLASPTSSIANINLIVFFVLTAWAIGFCLFNLTTRWLQILTLQEKDNLAIFQQQLTRVLHNTLFILAFSGLILFIPVFEQLDSYRVIALFKPLILLSVFFLTAGYYYKQRLHSYFVISILIITSLLSYGVLSGISADRLFSFQYELICLLIATTILTALFNLLYIYPKAVFSQLYAIPLQHISIISYTLSVVISLLLKIDGDNTSLHFLFLATLAFPLFSKYDNSAASRGYLIPILLSLSVLTNFDYYLFIGWSFTLWLLGYYAFPYINKIAKKDIIAANFSATLGLYLIIINFINFMLNSNSQYSSDKTGLIVFSTVYLCLMLNYPNWRILRWIAAPAVNLSGIAVLFNLFSISEQLILIGIAVFIWQNLLLMLIPNWRSYFTDYKAEIREAIAKPLEISVSALLLAGLASVSIAKTVDTELIIMSFGLNISLLHVLWRYPATWFLNIVLYSFLLSCLLILPDNIETYLQALVWTLLLQFSHLKLKTTQFSALIHIWFIFSFVISIALLLFGSVIKVDMQFIISLALLIYISFKEPPHQKMWLALSYLFSLILLHSIWLFNSESLTQQLLWSLPYYALQDIVLVWIVIWSQNKWIKIAEFTAHLTNWLLGLAIIFWLIHALTLVTQNTIGFNVDNTVAILDLCLLIALVIKSYHTELDKLVYYLAVILAVLGAYLHLCLFGLIGFNVYDAVILLVMSYLLLPLNYKLESHALYRLNFILPLPALLAISFVPSVNNSLLLLIIASFYLLLPRRKNESFPIYLSLIIFNAGIYLWIPLLATHYNLFSPYILPACVTTLFMLQLHSVELKPSLYHSVRLLSLTALYASVSVDIWLNKEMSLLLFMTVLLLTLASIILGIGLRIRAFLYTGSIFFVLNVMTQLIYITPENHLTKGIFLFVLGGIIFALMVWFQMQREEILQKMRIFRADLESWE